MTRDAFEILEFSVDDLAPATTVVDMVRARRAGWINLSPSVPDEAEPPPTSVLGQFFSTRGRVVPLVTIAPGTGRRDGTEGPTSLGIEHGRGERLRPWLVAEGLVAPLEWQLEQDHPKRGVVWEIGPDVASGPVVELLVTIADRLCPVETQGRWLAQIRE